MGNNSIILEREGKTGKIILNRPEALNTINSETIEGLCSALDAIEKDSSVHAILITGAGDKAFSAGADIKHLNEAGPLKVREIANKAVRTFRRIELSGKVSIAAIHGYALGGGLELAEACTFRIATADSMLGHPEVRIGAVAGWGGTTRLSRLVGFGRAVELLLTGKMITADHALNIGLINKIVDRNSLMDAAQNIIDEVLSCAPLAVRFSFEAISRGHDLPIDESLSIGADYFGLIASSSDFKEGTSSFIQKRPPSYNGQ